MGEGFPFNEQGLCAQFASPSYRFAIAEKEGKRHSLSFADSNLENDFLNLFSLYQELVPYRARPCVLSFQAFGCNRGKKFRWRGLLHTKGMRGKRLLGSLPGGDWGAQAGKFCFPRTGGGDVKKM
jgi:hypothetical protein